MRLYNCPLCVAPDALELKRDRKGRPMAFCTVCGTRMFMPREVGAAAVLYHSSIIERHGAKIRKAVRSLQPRVREVLPEPILTAEES